MAQSNTTACPLTWQVVSTPNVGTELNTLRAVSAVASNDVWAAGTYLENSNYHTLMLHWDGVVWSQVITPDVGGIVDILVIAPNDIWTGGGTNPLHWDGTMWQAITTPAAIAKMSALASDNIWALGQDKSVLHWDGTAWTFVSSPDVSGLPNPNLEDIHAVSDNDVWIVGYFTPGSVGVYPIVKHWNGSEWKSVPDDYAGYVFLRAIDGSADGTLWVAGSASWRASVEKWDGTAWRYITIPHVYGDSTGNDNFYGIDVRTVDDVWAVGSAHSFYPSWQPENPLIQHWDGATWRIQTVPFLPEADDILYSVSVVSNTEVWAVGNWQIDGVYQTLALYGSLPCNEIPAIPDTPKLVTPNKTTFTTLPIEFRWRRVVSTTVYHVQVSDTNEPYQHFTLRAKRPHKWIKRVPSYNHRFAWSVSACNAYGCSPARQRLFYYRPSSP
jgi:hypothetical protein